MMQANVPMRVQMARSMRCLTMGGIVYAYLRAKPLLAVLNVLLLALGVATLCFLANATQQLERHLTRDAEGIDLVVGAKGSPLQLILSGVYHLDIPTGNIPLALAEELAQHRFVRQAIPISLGDSLHGYRIVGTTPAYLAHYKAQFAQGKIWSKPMETVLGSAVAKKLGLQIGSKFFGAHGLTEGGAVHDDEYTVTGILQPTGSVLDRLVLTPTESVWLVHEGEITDPEDLKVVQAEREVTLVLLEYASPLAAVSLPREINARSEAQAASPAFESARLLQLVGVGVEVLHVFSGVLLLTAALSILIGLTNALQERRYDLAVLRSLGARRWQLAGLMVWEVTWLAALGAVLGLVLAHLALALLGPWLVQQGSVPLSPWHWAPEEIWFCLLTIGVAWLAGLVPAWRAARTEIHHILAKH